MMLKLIFFALNHVYKSTMLALQSPLPFVERTTAVFDLAS